jgi:hypothetical protein
MLSVPTEIVRRHRDVRMERRRANVAAREMWPRQPMNLGAHVTGASPVPKYKIGAHWAFPIDRDRRAPKIPIDASAGRTCKPPGAIARLGSGGDWIGQSNVPWQQLEGCRSQFCGVRGVLA